MRPDSCSGGGRGPVGTRRWWFALLVVLAAPVVAGCQGTVADPAGDSEVIDGAVDLVQAGVDYRTATTRFWVRYAPDNGPAAFVTWKVSTDGDTIPGYIVVVGSGQYVVYRDGNLTDYVCQGPEPDEPFDGKTELSIDTSCIASPSTGRPSKSLRISAESHALRYAEDHTGWTKEIPRS